MIRGLMVSARALTPLENAQEILANNLANSATGGFRQDRVAFHSQVAAALGGGAQPAAAEAVTGTAAATELTQSVDLSTGPLEMTEDRFHLAANGPGFFVVQGPEGDLYTRDGALHLGPDGTLLHKSGYPILSEGGAIVVPAGGTFSVAADGSITVNGEARGKVRLVTLADARGVTHAGPGLLRSETPAEADATSGIVQGAVEGANVDPVSTMVQMMSLLHDYEANQKALLTQDGSLGRLIQWAAG
jgi:flagellar basal-body rod protein FlgF